jgi:hypothetical protein
MWSCQAPTGLFPKKSSAREDGLEVCLPFFALERFPQLSPAFKNALFMGRFQGGTDDQADSG